MAVIVACHIRPSPPPIHDHIPFGNIPNISDPSVPRSVLAHSLLAAAVAIPALTPAQPTLEPEYCLSSKRKSHDDEDDENVHATKRFKLDSENDSLFGPLGPSPTPPPVTANPNNALSVTIEQAIAAIFDSPEVTPPLPSPQPQPATLPSDCLAPPRIPQSPLASPPSYAHAQDSEQPPNARPLVPPQSHRVVEPPLWKIACRTRVEHIAELYGYPTIRATVAHQASRTTGSARPDASPLVQASAHSSGSSDLRLEIYTPSSYASSSTSTSELDDDEDDDECMKSEFEMEDDVDMSFDLDDDSDSEIDEDEDESRPCIHESVLDVSLSETSSSSSDDSSTSYSLPRTPPLETSTPNHILRPGIPPFTALPAISTIPVLCLRTYPTAAKHGTPGKVAPWARGVLSRNSLMAQARIGCPGQPRSLDWW